MSQPGQGVPPYLVVYSGLCRDELKRLLARARVKERVSEVAQAVQGIHTQLQWIPLDFGQPLKDYVNLNMIEYIGVCAPLVVKYSVDEARRIVYVTLPFDLLSRSGL
jgi:hypothetical protein